MNTAVLRFAYGLTLLLLITTATTAQTFPAGFQAVQIKTGLNPTDLKVSPDGSRIFVLDKSGKVFMVQNDVWNTTAVLDISSQVDPFNEKGMLHLAFDPNFASNGFVYFYYTVKQGDGGWNNRIARYTFNFGTNRFNTTETVLLNLRDLLATIHMGGPLNFGPDGKLYVAVGENSQPSWGQYMGELPGKVLRMNPDGSIPTDNPFYNTLTGDFRYIYALGLRNPYSGDIQPGTGTYFINDVGQGAYEEISDIDAGKNYGWSLAEGPWPGGTQPANYSEPIYYYNHTSPNCAIVGAAFYNPTNATFPAQYVGKYFFADYCGGFIKALDPVTHAIHSTFGTNLGRVVSIAVRNSDGAMFYLSRGTNESGNGDPTDVTSSNEGILWKVTYTASQVPTIGAHPQSVTVPVGGNASFTVQANGPSLSYQWRKNGMNISGATSATLNLTNVQMVDNGAVFSCFVSNSFGNVTSNGATLTVTNRVAPTPTISAPLASFKYVGGNTINFSGSATDPVQGNIPASGLSWTVTFHHDTHFHPVLDLDGAASGSFTVPTVGEVSDNVWFRITLRATNDVDLTGSTFIDIFPQKVTIALRSVPSGVSINVDGTTTPTPADILSVINVQRDWVAADTYTLVDSIFTFSNWENSSTDPERTFNAPATNTTMTATYAKTAVFAGVGLQGEYWTNTNSFAGTPAITRTDAQVAFNWGTGSPGAGVTSDVFCARWTGQVQPRTTGTYTFYTFSDNGARLWVNDQLIIDNWTTPSGSEVSGTIALTAGQKYNFKLEYFETTGNASVMLNWSGPNVAKQLVPQKNLYATAAAVPVIFKSFTVIPAKDYIQLNWSVAESVSVKGYYVQRRQIGGGAFEQIAFVPELQGQYDYSYQDFDVEKNVIYEYRIKEEDMDGTPTYSMIRTGFLTGRVDLDVVTIPNPAIASNIIKVIFNRPADAELTFLTSDGKRLASRSATLMSGQTMFDFPTRDYAAGVYYLKIVTKEKTLTKKILIQ